MEENKRGQGIFLGVVGVATLVVAIIGATFAYFSASATNNSTVAGNTAAAGGLSLTITELVGDGSGLIPLNVKTGDTSGVDTTSQLTSALGNLCVDNNGSQVCSIYKVDVSNSSSTNALLVNGKLRMAFDNGTNIRWGVLTQGTNVNLVNGTAGEGQASLGKSTFESLMKAYENGLAKDTDGYLTITGTNAYTASTPVTLAASGHLYYYVLVWLEELGTAQETADAAKAYLGTVTFNATDSNGAQSGVTATFTS